jgi:amino acid adenylation domain-containing protein/non-ribosomal peptide synthase protein (TIGR01720 family)
VTLLEILETASRLGIHLWAEGDKLRVRAPQGSLTPELRAALERNKPQLVSYLREANGGKARSAFDRCENPEVLSFGQERLWFLDQLAPKSAAYHVQVALQLTGPLDKKTLEQSFRELIRRHEILRTTFPEKSGRPLQMVAPDLPFEIPTIDISPERHEEVEQIALAHGRRKFDLGVGPLIRAVLIKLAPEEHELLIAQHHIITDAWSTGIFASELAAIYTALSRGTQPLLQSPRVQYRDFALWQRKSVERDIENLRAYWTKRLEGLPPLELPTDRTRPRKRSHRGDLLSFEVSVPVTRSLKELSRQEDSTLFVTLFTAFAALLHRYSNQVDFGIATITAGREHAALKNQLGFFANTIVLRCDHSGNPTFRELMRRTKDVALDALDHRNLPFEEVVRSVGAQRDQGLNPLVEACFVFENAPVPDLRIPGMSWRPRLRMADGAVEGGAFDLGISMMEADGRLLCSCGFSTDIFDRGTIERLAGHLNALLTGVVAAPKARLSELPLLAEVERRKILVEWNDTAKDFPSEKCIHELFEQQVERTPDAVAVVFEDRQLTYRELNARANRLAHHLRGLGVGSEVLVGICVERSIEMVVGILGILKAGGAYLPLDPSHPEERLRFMLADANAAVLLTQERLRERIGAQRRPLVCLDADWIEISRHPTENPRSSVLPENAVYAIYTSGSTGRPKGALIVHRGLVNYLSWCTRHYDVEAGTGAPVDSSLAFDLTVTSLWAPLVVGRRVELLPEQSGGRALADALRREGGYSLVKITPAHLELLTHELAPAEAKGRARAFIVGGEQLSSESVAFWLENAPDTVIVNEYGPTETVVGCCVFHVPADWRRPGAIPIGRPIANTKLYILDPELGPVPVGVAGELYIGGPGVARGYLGQPDLTAARFVPDPFGGEPGARLYRTGDLARWLSDGNIEYLGRIDHQVKVRGYRIELGEIEAALAELPGVEASVVLAREDRLGEKRLVGYVVPRAETTSSTLRDALKAKLPDYMIPSAFVFLEALPLTPNGKVDRKALPAPDAQRPELDEAYVAPWTPVEESLAWIWCEVLNLKRIGLNENFFEVGGDSILSIQVVSRARAAGLELTPSQIFEHPTIAEQAAAAVRKESETSRQDPESGEIPLTPIERWFFERELPEPHQYCQTVLVELTRRVPYSMLASAVDAVVAHHDAFRLRFVRADSGWRQAHAETSGVTLATFDLTALAGEAQGRALAEQAQELQASLSLSEGPLARAALFDLGPDRGQRLLLVIHHLVVDGISWRVLVGDLQTALRQILEGKSVDLGPRTTSFKRWSEQLLQWGRSGALEEELGFWLEQDLGSAPPLPIDYSLGPNLIASAETIRVSLEAEETRALLQDSGRAYGTQAQELLLAALARTLATATRVVSFDLEGHGREEIFEGIDVSRTVGWFTTLFPVGLAFPNESGSGALLKAVKETLRAVPRRGVGYGLLRYLHPKEAVRARLARASKGEVLFNYLGQFDSITAAEGSLVAFAREPIGAPRTGRGLRSHILDINAHVADGRLELAFSYSPNLHRRETIQTLACRYVENLRAILAHCASPEAGGYTPSDFPLAGLDQPTLNRLFGKRREVETVYPLSAMQEGMLFHTLLAPGSAIYFEQTSARISGADVEIFEAAWREVVARHPVLRTFVLSEGLARPLQCVQRSVDFRFERYDWRELDGDAVAERIESFLAADRERGFALDQAPLMRAYWISLAGGRAHFVWSFHHIIADGWSVSRLMGEVVQIYKARLERRSAMLPSASPYEAYIRWLGRQDPAASEEFWRGLLKDFSAPTLLGIRRTSAIAATTDKSFEENLILSPAATAALQVFARQHGLTINTLFLGAWALLLSRYSGERDVLFGMTVSGRPAELPHVESMAGLFINTLPLRIDVDPNSSTAAWLDIVQDRQVALRAHEAFPLARIQRLSAVPKTSPLFETILVFENYPVDAALRSARIPFEIESLRVLEQTNYPITLVVVPGNEISLRLQFDPNAYEREAIRRLLVHLQVILEGLSARPEARLSELPLLTETERRKILADNSTEFPSERCVHELFEEQVERTPDAVAVVFEDREVTYRELNLQANQLAHHLRELGVGPEVLVGICVERSIEMVVGVLGILKAGGAYLPLDLAYPRERLAFMLEDAGVRILVTQRGLSGQLPSHSGITVLLDEPALAEYAAVSPQSGSLPGNLAYVIYTSGSTGKPKGVMVRHDNVARLLRATEAWFQFGPADVWTLFHSYAFDFSVWELWGALLYGGRVVVVPYLVSRSPEAFLDLLSSHRVTVLNQTPSAFRQLIRADQARGEATSLSLRLVIFGGEALELGSLLPWFERHGEDRPLLVNMYGITETTVHVTYRPLRHRDLDDAVGSMIGQPIPDLQLYILGPSLELLPVGIAGEIYVGGAGVSRGYLGRRELTAQRFIPDPFSDKPGSRLYRTGDLARQLPKGDIEYLGRIDHQVKIRGYRIELGEIEAALAEVPGVETAVVLAREDRPGEKRLVAYVVPNGSASASTLRETLKTKLPGYMVPSAFVSLGALPLTPNGKIDRKALPAPDAPELDERYVAPRTPVEELLAGIWCEVLNLERVGIRHDFFDLGGHSLLATRVVSRIRSLFGVELPLRSMFERPTIERLATEIETAKRGDVAIEATPIPSAPREGRLPLSFAQQRLWFLDQLEPGNAAYNIPLAFRLDGALDPEALRRGLEEIVRRHEILRTTFLARGGGPFQEIGDSCAVPLSIVDLEGLAPDEKESEIRRQAEKEPARPFDLARGPLLRASLLRLSERDHVFLITMHHILSDGWSMGIMALEVSALYRAFAAGKPSPLPTLSIQYADFALWQRNWLTGGTLERELAYWKEKLATLVPLDLPTDRPRPPIPTFRGATLRATLSPELTRALERLSRKEGVSLFMTVLAAFKALLHRYSGQSDIPVGTPIANRTRVETEPLIGFFVNTIVLRTDLSGDPSFEVLLSRVREVSLDAYAHQDLPFERLVEEVSVKRDLSRTPLFQVMFVFQNAPDSALEIPGLTVRPLEVETGAVKFDLTLVLEERGGTVEGSLEYNTDLFERSTIERLWGHFETLLRAVVADPQVRLSELPLLTEAERRKILIEWNDTATEFPNDKCVHELFEEQVDRTPDAIAVVFEDRELTYIELNARANQLAHHLRKLGVGPEVLVGICFERSIEIVVSLLGILKAGGAYLPLDPSHPEGRLRFMLEDARAAVLLTQERLRHRIGAPSTPLVCLDADWAELGREPTENLCSGAIPENLVYVIYTSGSTGAPKGVEVPHRAVARLVRGVDYAALDNGPRILQLQPLAFDVATGEIWGALLNGGRCVLAPPGLVDAPILDRLVSIHRIDTLWLTAALFHALMDEDSHCLSRVGQVVVGGEPLSVAHVRRYRSSCSNTRLINGYGPTECTTVSCCYSIPPTIPLDWGSIPIGPPIANTEVYVLDGNFEPVPIGVPGEVYLGGPGLARDYLGRPELTAERFVPNPFGREPGERLYRTGDLARFLPDGNLDFLGRIDHQVKIRGYRIELGEIEAALAEAPGVGTSVVLAREDRPRERRLVGYVVPNGSAKPTSSTLREALNAKLPNYMVPSAFVFLEALPLTPNGKVDRKALPAPDAAELDERYLAPRTPVEELLAAIWCEVLHLERVGIRHDFFELGGHSLLATQVVSRVRSLFGVELPLRSLFERPTIEALATEIAPENHGGFSTDRPRPPLTDAERRKILVEWNDTATKFPSDKCVHELFEEQAERTPDAIAVVSEDRELTYHQLNARSNQLAHHLRGLGVGPEALVGICVERSIEMVVGLLGILKAGGAYLPLDPSYPEERLRFILADAKAAVLLIQERLRDRIGVPSTPLVCLDADWAEIGREPTENLASGALPENLVYAIYTSGSTGRPKGVEVLHRGVARLVRGVGYATLDNESRILHLSPLAFDVSTFEIWGALLNGGQCVVAPPGLVDAPSLERLVSIHRINTLWLTAALFNALLDEDSRCLSHVGELLVGGEALSVAHIRRYRSSYSNTRLTNGYGPTECTTFSCCYSIPALIPLDWGSIPIGPPIANTEVYVLDGNFEPVPIGVPGELYLGGAGLARDYLGRPDLTAERFVPNPFGRGPGERLYRTGDLSRWLPGGDLEYLGRIDHQVKIRGYRIELGEIEAALAEVPGVAASVVLAREDRPGEKRIVGYVVPNGSANPTASTLREALKAKLPHYMVPSVFVFVEVLPLTPNGKVDRKALPAPDAQELDGYVAPRTPAEEVLAGIWCEVLHLERAGIRHDFFELGGHSLLATQLVSRIRSTFGVELPLRSMFERPTIEGQVMEIAKRSDLAIEARKIPSVRRDGPLPLSFAQQRLWFLEELDPGTPRYNIGLALRLRGPLNPAILERSVDEIVRRHEALRTTFTAADWQASQVVAPSLALPWTRVDLYGLPKAEREEEARRLATEESQRPLDLASGPLVRALRIELSAQDHVVALTMHHIVADGWSIGVLVRELAAIYRAFARGEPSPLAEPPTQYVDFAIWQRAWLTGAVLDEQVAYWKGRLGGPLPMLRLPADRPRPPIQSSRGARHRFRIAPALREGLDALARREGATLFMALLAAFDVLLYRSTGETDILVGSPVANRKHPGTEALVGFFVNTLVFRSDLSGDPMFRTLLARVRETALGAYEHQDLPFEKVVEAIDPERDLGRSPIFQVMLALQNAPRSAPSLPGLSVEPIEIEPGTAKFDLLLDVEEDGERGLAAVFEYSTDLFEPLTVARMAERFEALLATLIASPDMRISQLPILTDAERLTLLEWSATPAEPEPERCLHELFEEQVERMPDAVAVIFGEQQLSYRELDRRANRLANRLRRLGVGPDALVGICLQRSVELIVALLGVLKAGGGYVPLDPGYPRERLAFMLRDARAGVLLTQRTLAEVIEAVGARVLLLDDADEPELVAGSDGPPTTGVRPDHVAYVIYTSGSTGRPKGVAIPHRGIVNHMRWMRRRFPLAASNRVLQRTATSFDASVWEFYAPLIAGATLVVAPPAAPGDVASLAQLIAAHEVTDVQFVPSLLRLLVESKGIERCPTLQRVFCGGEALTSELARRFVGGSAADLVNLYGPTETTIDATFFAGGRTAAADLVPIGRPIAGLQAYVLDSRLELAPIGAQGELYIGGAGVARGYLGRPDLTAERFLPDPFSNEPGARVYRTGDLARWLPGGELEFLGRIDHQVKIRGHRVELGEVEAVLAEHPAVIEVAAVVRDDEGVARLAAYASARGDRDGLADDLRAHARRKLTGAMIPASFVILDELPHTPSGKVDRRALPAPPAELRAARPSAEIAPRDRFELELRGMWEDVLGVRPIGVSEDFFDLGGHSMMALRLASEIHRRFGREFPLAELFQRRTIEKLAELLRAAPIDLRSPLVRIKPSGSRRPFFCVHGAGGSAYPFSELARHLPDDRPFYGLEAAGLAPGSEPDATIEAMASRYLEAIRSIDPSGPYRLGGWSAGGAIAFEIAQQALRDGQEVALLAIIDTRPARGRDHAAALLDNPKRLAIQLARNLAGMTGQPLELTIEDGAGLDEVLDRLAEAAQHRGLLPPGGGRPLLRRLHDVFRAVVRAHHEYAPPTYPRPILCCRAAEPDPEVVADTDPSLGWDSLTSAGATVETIPGDHFSMLRLPHVKVLAERLAAALDRVG